MKKYKQLHILRKDETTWSSRVISDLAKLAVYTSHCVLIVKTYLQQQVRKDVCDEVMKDFCMLGLQISKGK